MKKLIVLGLVIIMVLSVASIASAVSVSPEVEGLYWSNASSFAIAGGALIKVSPLGGIRTRAGYLVNNGKGFLVLVDGVVLYPVHPRAEIVIGGGINWNDSSVANVSGGVGGQAYGGINIRASEKIGIFVDGGWVNSATKAAGVTARTNNFGMAFGMRANLGQ